MIVEIEVSVFDKIKGAKPKYFAGIRPEGEVWKYVKQAIQAEIRWNCECPAVQFAIEIKTRRWRNEE